MILTLLPVAMEEATREETAVSRVVVDGTEVLPVLFAVSAPALFLAQKRAVAQSIAARPSLRHLPRSFLRDPWFSASRPWELANRHMISSIIL
ncbi:hypothetical protein [Pseudodesulfovibrio piezophilus]|uniref:hypothetical protein n=1 Tax=Pseudodesulfovibrio piezophilus TaxID=879567 RepID=UPI00034812EE|nr:hypothetical protein [Pseudodesulfovibrio piezophilus]